MFLRLLDGFHTVVAIASLVGRLYGLVPHDSLSPPWSALMLPKRAALHNCFRHMIVIKQIREPTIVSLKMALRVEQSDLSSD
jgi:hypothetical protein